MAKIIYPICKNCIFASDPWTMDGQEFRSCIKVTEGLFIDDDVDFHVKENFGCIFFKDRDEKNSLPDN